MKKNPPDVQVRPQCVKKNVRVMRLTLFLMAFLFVSVSVSAQNVNISVKTEMTLNEVLKQIKDQSGVRILYDAGKTRLVSCKQDDDKQYECC